MTKAESKYTTVIGQTSRRQVLGLSVFHAPGWGPIGRRLPLRSGGLGSAVGLKVAWDRRLMPVSPDRVRVACGVAAGRRGPAWAAGAAVPVLPWVVSTSSRFILAQGDSIRHAGVFEGVPYAKPVGVVELFSSARAFSPFADFRGRMRRAVRRRPGVHHGGGCCWRPPLPTSKAGGNEIGGVGESVPHMELVGPSLLALCVRCGCGDAVPCGSDGSGDGFPRGFDYGRCSDGV